MTNNSNRKLVPEAMDSLEKFKYEVANEVGVNLKNGYNGNIKEYRDGYSRVLRNKHWGFTDMEGKEVIPCRYDYV